MNETSESIHKKTWHLPRAVLIWLASFILVVFAAMMVVGSMPSVRQEPPHPLSVFITGIIGASVLLCLWLFGHWSTRCWRNLRRTLLGLAVLATSIALFYTEENWRGKRAWEHCERELARNSARQGTHSRMFREGEAEGKNPTLSNLALAKWADKTRRTLICPRCGISELVDKS